MESATNKPKRLHILRLLFTGFRTSEFKLWILFLYYWIIILSRLNFIAVSLRNTDNTNKYLDDYIFCSLGGYKDECRVYEEQLQEETVALLVMSYISTVLLSFVHLINLFFVIPFSDAKETLKRLLSR